MSWTTLPAASTLLTPSAPPIRLTDATELILAMRERLHCQPSAGLESYLLSLAPDLPTSADVIKATIMSPLQGLMGFVNAMLPYFINPNAPINVPAPAHLPYFFNYSPYLGESIQDFTANCGRPVDPDGKYRWTGVPARGSAFGFTPFTYSAGLGTYPLYPNTNPANLIWAEHPNELATAFTNLNFPFWTINGIVHAETKSTPHAYLSYADAQAAFAAAPWQSVVNPNPAYCFPYFFAVAANAPTTYSIAATRCTYSIDLSRLVLPVDSALWGGYCGGYANVDPNNQYTPASGMMIQEDGSITYPVKNDPDLADFGFGDATGFATANAGNSYVEINLVDANGFDPGALPQPMPPPFFETAWSGWFTHTGWINNIYWLNLLVKPVYHYGD